MARLFGTDGVRGIANTELGVELAFSLGRFGALVLAGQTHHKPKILVGSDTRISCPMLECALVAGICSAGADAYVCGVIPTPGIAKLVVEYGYDAGVMISASHNSYEFNGIKFFNGEGFKLPDQTEDQIEQLITDSAQDSREWPSGADVGRRFYVGTASSDYVRYLKEAISPNLAGMKIALDCANGATAPIAPELFRSLNAQVVCIGVTPDGININKDCGSTHLKALSDLVKSEGLDLGIAFDGDGDRMLAIDSDGELVDGDVMMAIIALDMKNSGRLRDDALVVTVMSNLGLDHFAQKQHIELKKTKVGDRYVLEEMIKNRYSIGGEQSGHIILLDHATTGDGLLSALMLLDVIKRAGKTLGELRSVMKVLPQVLKGIKVNNEVKSSVLNDPALLFAKETMEKELGDRGRILIRASGTEPLIRVMLEGEDLQQITGMCDELIAIIRDGYVA